MAERLGRTVLSTSNGDRPFRGDCDSQGHLVGKKYVDAGARRTTCCTFLTIVSLSSQSKRDHILGRIARPPT